MTTDLTMPEATIGQADDLHGVGRGALWSGLSAVVLRAGNLAMGIVTARLLAPRDLGVFAVAATVHTLLVSASELGLGAALTRHSGDVRQVAPTVASLAMATSALLATLMMATAPTVARALGSPDATEVVRVLALTLLLTGVATVPAALLVRDFRQDKRFAAEVAGFVVSGLVVVVLLVRGWGPVGLAWARVAGSAAAAAVLVRLAPAWHRPSFDAREARRLVRFGLPLAGAGLVGITLTSLDYAVISRVQGGRALGLYVLAFTISSWPINIFTSTVRGVGVPAFARVGPARLPRHVGSALRMLVTLALPVSALIAALADPLVAGLYGSRWGETARVLALLAVFGAIRVPLDLLDNVLVAIGATRHVLLIQSVWLLLLAPALVIGVRTEGIAGAAIAHIGVVTLVVLPMYVTCLTRLAGIDARMLARAVARPTLSAVAAGFAAHTVAARFAQPWLGLITGALVGALSYLAFLGPWLLSLWAESRTLWAPTTAPGTSLVPGSVEP